MHPDRLAVGLLGLVVCAWFALGIRQAQGTARATHAVAQSHLSSPERASTAASLSSAATLNPDLEIDVLRGRLALQAGDRIRARQILRRVTNREPQNLEAWIWLGQAANGNVRLLGLALVSITRLDPRVATAG